MKEKILKIIGKINYKHAAWLLVIIPIPVIVFHVLIILGYIPFDIVWGGRLTEETMIWFELLGISLNILLLIIGLIKVGIITNKKTLSLSKKTEWFMFYFLLINTILNPFSATAFEAIVFTPVVGIYCLSLFRVIYKS